MSDLDLFGEPWPSKSTEPTPKLSPDRARTERAKARLARGVHPLHAWPLAVNLDGSTCGDCRHLRVKSYAGTYFKCALYSDTKGPATDTRKKWPACVKWEPMP